MPGKPFDPTPQEFEAAFSKAISVIDLAERLGCYPNTLRRWARRNGIDLSPVRSWGCVVKAPKVEDDGPLTKEDILKLCNEHGIEIVKHPVVEDLEHEVEAMTFNGDGAFKIGVVSDAHLGSKYQQLTFLEAAYDYFSDNDIDTVINAGDLVGGSDKMHPGMVHELFVHGGDEQTEYAAKAYPERDGIITYIVSGNHDHSHMKANGTNVVKNVCKERDDMQYMGMSGAYLTVNGIRIYVHHPSGGVAYARSYRLQKQIEQFSPENKPKVLIVGHLHVTCVLESYRNVYGFVAGCFEAQTPYLTEKGVYPEVGFSVLEVTYDDEGAVKFKKEWVPLYVPKEHDYKWSG